MGNKQRICKSFLEQSAIQGKNVAGSNIVTTIQLDLVHSYYYYYYQNTHIQTIVVKLVVNMNKVSMYYYYYFTQSKIFLFDYLNIKYYIHRENFRHNKTVIAFRTYELLSYHFTRKNVLLMYQRYILYSTKSPHQSKY